MVPTLSSLILEFWILLSHLLFTNLVVNLVAFMLLFKHLICMHHTGGFWGVFVLFTQVFASRLPNSNLFESVTLYAFTYHSNLFYDAPMTFECGNMFCSKCLMTQKTHYNKAWGLNAELQYKYTCFWKCLCGQLKIVRLASMPENYTFRFIFRIHK